MLAWPCWSGSRPMRGGVDSPMDFPIAVRTLDGNNRLVRQAEEIPRPRNQDALAGDRLQEALDARIGLDFTFGAEFHLYHDGGFWFAAVPSSDPYWELTRAEVELWLAVYKFNAA